VADATGIVGVLRVLLQADTVQFEQKLKTADKNVQAIAQRLKMDLEPSQRSVNAVVRQFLGTREIGAAERYAKAVQQIGGANRLTAGDQAKVNRVVTEALGHYKALGQQAPPHLLALANATKQVEAPTSKLNTTLSTMKGVLGAFGISVGVSSLVSFGKSVFAAADQIGDLAQKMGVSTEAAQRFQFAARQSGADIEDVTRALVQMNDRLAEGDKGTVGALTAAGLKFQEIRAMRPEVAFRTIADAIGRIADPMQQTQVAMELFGKAGQELLPMIREGTLKVADSVRVMSDETVQRLKEAKQSWENFWAGLTIVSGEAIVKMFDQWHKFIADFRTGVVFLARVAGSGGNVAQALALGSAEFLAAEASKTKARPATTGPAPFSPEGLGLGLRHLPSLPQTKEERDREAAAVKKAAEDAKRLNELYRAFERERLTGVTDTQRQRQAFEARFLAERGLTGAAAWARAIVSPISPAALFGGSVPLGAPPAPVGGFPIARPPGPKFGPNFFQPGVSAADLAKGVPVASLGMLFRGGMSTTLGQAPQTILAALTGGGNVGKALGSLFGGNLAGSLVGKSTEGVFESGLGKSLQGVFGKSFGGAIANLLPGIGALLGPIMGKVFGAIGNLGKNVTLGARQDFAKQLGFESLDNLFEKLRSLGPEGDRLVSTALNVIGKKDEAANRRWMADVTKFFDRLEKVPGKVQELSAALGKFGGAIPSQLDPLLDSILGQAGLSGDLRRQLEGLKKPSWQSAQDLASTFGIQLGALGGGFNQARLAESAFQLTRALDVFKRFEGADQNAILRDMADEFSALAREAMKNNVALPRAIQQFIRQVDEMGLLLDENGNRIDLSLLKFADIEDEYQQQVVSLLEQIRDLLAGPSATTPGRPQLPWIEPSEPGEGRRRFREGTYVGLPSFAGGTRGQYMDFGPGTPVMLHGSERVMTAGEAGAAHFTINVMTPDTQTFESWLRRGAASVIARTLTPELERIGLAR